MSLWYTRGMISASLLKFLTNSISRTSQHYFYQIDGHGHPLYVGRSFLPARRLRQHIAIHGLNEIGTFGKLFYCNLPDSLSWQVQLYTLLDCEAVVYAYYRSDLFLDPPDIRVEQERDYHRFASASPTEQYYNVYHRHTGFLTDAEAALIWHYRPCVNVALQVTAPVFPKGVRSPMAYFTRFPTPLKARALLKHYLAKAKGL